MRLLSLQEMERQMRSPKALLMGLLAGTLLAAGTTEAAHARPKPGKGGGKGGGSKGAPGPIAGTGLSFVALAGIYWLVRRRISRANEKRDAVGGATRELPTGADRGPV
jgi:hypothetical protein